MSVKDSEISFAISDIYTGMRMTIYRLTELEVWVSPVVVIAYVFCAAIKVRNRSIAFFDLVFPAFVVGYVFFTDLGGNRYGPRYYFEGFPLMMVTIVSSAPQAAAVARRLLDRPFAFHGLLVCAIYLLTSWPFAFAAYHELVASRQEPYRLAAAYGLSNAIVIVSRSGVDDGMIADDLARNDASLVAPVLFARANTDAVALQRLFPQRSVWTYRNGERGRPGKLVPLNASGNP